MKKERKIVRVAVELKYDNGNNGNNKWVRNIVPNRGSPCWVSYDCLIEDKSNGRSEEKLCANLFPQVQDFAIDLLKCLQKVMEENLFGEKLLLERRVSHFEKYFFITYAIWNPSKQEKYAIYPFSFEERGSGRAPAPIVNNLISKMNEEIGNSNRSKALVQCDIVNVIKLDKLTIKGDKIEFGEAFSWAESREEENEDKDYFEHVLRLPSPYTKEGGENLEPLDIIVAGDTIFKNLDRIVEICHNPTYGSILIFGKPGAGKEVIKNAIYYGSAFYPILRNISLVNQLAKEINEFLFGYYDQFGRHQRGLLAELLEKGKKKAFLFIDEVDKLQVEVRSSLLRLLENKKYFVPNSVHEESAEGMRYIFGGSFTEGVKWGEEAYENEGDSDKFLSHIKENAVKKIKRFGPPDFWTRIDKAVLVATPCEPEFYEALFKKEWGDCVKKHLEIHFGTPGPLLKGFEKYKEDIDDRLRLKNTEVKKGGEIITIKYKNEIIEVLKDPIKYNFKDGSIREFKNMVRGEVGKCFQKIITR